MFRFLHDVQYSIRQLARAPILTAVAILSLALGLGANVAVFSLLNALLFRDLPVSDPQQLVDIHSAFPGRPSTGYFVDPVPFGAFEEIRLRNTVFSHIFAWDDEALRNIKANGAQYPGAVIEVSGDYFATLGVHPLLGRLLRSEDTVPGEPAKVTVLDYRCWDRRFQRDPAVIGKIIRVDNVPLTVVGVTPKSFRHLDVDVSVEAAVPIGFNTADVSRRWYKVLARLKPDVTIQQARSQLQTLWPAIQQSIVPSSYTAAQRQRFFSRRLYVQGAAHGFSYLREQISRPLGVLMYLVVAVLLIACANLAGLMLARGSNRRHELAVRIALGAGRWLLIRQLLIESVMLSFTGAVLGFVCCFWTGHYLLSLIWMGKGPIGVDTSPDLRVLGFAAAIAIVTGIAFGIGPAARASRIDPAGALQQNSRTARDGGTRLRRILIVAQVAVSLILTFAAALFIRTFYNLWDVDAGYQRHGVLCMELFPQPGHEKLTNRGVYYRALVAKLNGIPGIESVSYSNGLPMSSREFSKMGSEMVSELPPGSSTVQASLGVVGPGFFEVMGMHVLAGRGFTWNDDENAPKVTVISQSLAERLFPKQNPLGRRISIANAPDGKDLRIVGVVNNASLWSLESYQPAAAYTGFLQTAGYNQPMVDIRTGSDPSKYAQAAERAVESLGYHYSVQTQSLRQRLDMFLGNERILALLSSFFGALALVLAGMGLYGVISHSVTTRISEIGIRIALGAQRGNIFRLFLCEAALLVIVGLAVGIPLALMGSRVVSGMLFGVAPFSTVSILLPSSVLIFVVFLAVCVPVRRASKIEPATALRTE
ncbi:MAG TPA: ABC transporter permease [Bryobacteraceae bacterium]|nr:ABC transporter permease [Bryobacteraceae bacterium]